MNLRYTKQRLQYAVLLPLFFLSALNLFAQTQYIGPANGDWFTVANWNNGLPAVGNNANISGGASVNISQALLVNFSISNFGTINNSAALEVATNFVSGGALNNAATGTITVDAGIQLIASGGIINAGTITNKGGVIVNTVSFTNNSGAVVINQGNWQQLAAFTNTGTVNDLSGLFTSPQVFTNTGIVNISSGANWTVDFGGSFVNAIGSALNNAGGFTNLASFINNTTVTNTGTFTNNSIQNCNGIFNNESGGTIANASTFNIAGRLNNKSGASVQNGGLVCVLANGFVSNLAGATFNNNNKITVKLNGIYSNEVNSVLSLGVGSILVDSGYVKNLAGAKMVGSGSINNASILDNFGTIQSDNGSTITNSDTINNHGYIVTINIVNNSGYISNDSLIRINSGATFNNTGNILNKLAGTFENNFEFYNKTGATFINNGTFRNNIRLFNGGTYTNNGYLALAGDFFNQIGGKLINTEVIEINSGSIVNVGIITNSKTIYNDPCSVISNNIGGSIANSGTIQTKGVVFQRSILTGNAIINLSGWIQTAPTSDAKICVDTIRTGTTPQGEAKVYPQNVLLRLGLDSCNNFQYSVDGSTRRVYTCADAGKVLDAKFILKLRTGDSLTCNTKVSVFDGIAPVLSSCPSDVKILSTNNSEIYSWATITATDNCTGPAKVSSTTASGSAFPIGTTQVTITATDSFKNSALCSFKVTVQKIVSTTTCTAGDKTLPIFANCPQNKAITTPNGGAVVAWNEPSVTANCYPVILTSNFSSGSFFSAGSTNVVYTATDVNKNVGTCSFTVSVSTPDPCLTDNVKPNIVGCPSNLFLILNTANNASVGIWQAPIATDNCGAVVLTSGNFASGYLFPAGQTTVTYTATDLKNNSSICKFTVNVAATKPCASTAAPVFSNCPSNVTVNATGNSAAGTWTEPSATSTCGGLIINANYFSGSFFPIGITKVVYSASDIVGNTAQCTFNVTVKNACLSDTIVPIISGCPANISVVSTTGTTATATWTSPTATDNCSTATLVSNYQSGASFLVGSTTITYTAFDLSGNKSLPCTFTVTVTTNPCANDTQAPVFSNCPTNITVTAAQNATSAIATWTAPTATDNCGTPTVTSSANSGSSFNIGTTTVTYTAKDAKNNTSTCVFTVTVNGSSVCAPPKSVSKDWMFLGSVNGKNYYKFVNSDYNDGYINYWIGKELCESIDGHLPVIKNQAENDFIKNGIGNKNCWVGMKRTYWGSSQWICDDNSTPTYFNWNDGEPNNYNGNETTVQMYGNGSGKWNDCASWTNNCVVCEVPCTKCTPSITRTVSNSTECSNKSVFGIWLNNKYYSLTNANFTENSDLTAKLTANCDLGTVILNFTGRTTSGMPVFNTSCFTPSSTADWYFYNNFAGTIGSYSVSSNPMHKFQIGTSANNHNKDVYGGSGWIIGTGVTGDLNILLSGNTATLNQITCPNNAVVQHAQSAKVFEADAQAESNRVRIDFSTNRGVETDYFNVQKLNSATGNFETLVIENNSVSDNSLQAHSVYDNNPNEGANYYQVEIALNDGSKSFSDVKKVAFSTLKGLVVFPNPANDYIDVNLKDYVGKDVTIYVYNHLGVVQRVHQVQNVSSTTPEHLDINNLSGGQYLLRVESKGLRDAVQSVIVTH